MEDMTEKYQIIQKFATSATVFLLSRDYTRVFQPLVSPDYF